MSIVNNKSHLSPYSKTSAHQQSQPLRTKAFSHTDNLPNHIQEHSNSPTKQSNDRIEQIKRKYDKIFINSNGKNPPEIQGNSRKMIRHSQLQMSNQNCKYSNLSKYGLQSGTSKESGYKQITYDENLKTMNPRQYPKKDYSGAKNTEMKSQIDYNRATLNHMKSQLQGKLNEVYTKTSNKSTQVEKRHEKSASLTFNPNHKLSSQEAMTYQAIINKYSKSISGNKTALNSQNGNAVSILSKMEHQNPSKYKTKYDSAFSNNNTASLNYKYSQAPKKYDLYKQKGERRQLSIISQISNSNNSQAIKENQQHLGRSSNSTNINMHRKDANIGQNTKYNAQSKIIIQKYNIQKPQSKYSKNTPNKNDEQQYQLKENYQQKGFEKQIDRKQYNNYVGKEKINYTQGLPIKETTYKTPSYKESYKQLYKDTYFKQPQFNQSYKEPYFKDSAPYQDHPSKYADKSSKYDDVNWLKDQGHKNHLQRQQDNQHLEFTLNKLQNNQQFTIKRTVTEEYFTNLHKANYMQTRNQIKSNTSTNFMPSKNAKNYEMILEETQLQKTYNYPKNNYDNRTPNAKQNRSVSIHEPSKYYNEERSQIQKLKDKYKLNSHSKSTNENCKGQKSPLNNNNQSEARNNQSISKEIQRLDQRIKLIEQNKRQLNLNFKPYEMSKSYIRNTQTNNGGQINKDNAERQKTASKEYSKYQNINAYSNTNVYSHTKNHQIAMNSNPSASKLQNQSKIYTSSTIKAQKTRTNTRYQGYIDRVKPIYSQITLPQSCKKNSNPFQIKLIPVEKDDDFQRDYADPTGKSRTKDYMNRLQIQNRTDYGIQERKKKLQNQVQIKNNLKSLVKSFGQQASFDENFRNNKIWFASQRNNSKWEELHQELQKRGVNYTINELKKQFQLLQSENNPFFSITDHKCDIKSLVNTYFQSKNHWDQKIYKQYQRSQIQKEGFNNSKLDSDRKGYIQIEDFVRFLNIESGTFLRNRDLSIIFRRINQTSQKITYEQLINTVSH